MEAERLSRAWERTLAADPARRRARGAYFTPDFVAAHVVERVHRVLIEDFGLPLGLADESFVEILDPAAGAGVFLRHAVIRIHAALAASPRRWRAYVRESLLPRIHGLEVDPATRDVCRDVVARAFAETGAPIDPARIDVRVADALASPTPHATVLLGNPPWQALGSRAPHTDRLLRDSLAAAWGAAIPGYYEVDGVPLGERKTWLQDEYVKFLRLAQRSVAHAGGGVVGFVTNHGWLDNPTFRGVRRSLLRTFTRIDVVDLHGNSKRGERDENVFDEVRQGAAIAIFARPPGARGDATVMHADLRGSRADKRVALAAPDALALARIEPAPRDWRFVPTDDAGSDTWRAWPSIPELFALGSTGIVTARDHFVIDLDEDRLIDRIGELRDDSAGDDELRRRWFSGRGAARYPDGDSRGWKLPAARAALRGDRAWRSRVAPCWYRPFDTRSIYWAPWMIDWPRPEVMRHLLAPGAIALVCTRRQSVDEPWALIGVAGGLVESCYLSNRTSEIGYVFPLRRYADPGAPSNVAAGSARGSAEDVLHWIYAVAHAPSYRAEWRSFLAREFPRIPPIPDGAARVLRAGARLVELHLGRATARANVRLVGRGDDRVEEVRVSRGEIWINATQRFAPVPERVAAHRVGAYAPCVKWLKDRRGRRLTGDDVARYRGIVGAIAETIRIAARLDEELSAIVARPRVPSNGGAAVAKSHPITIDRTPA